MTPLREIKRRVDRAIPLDPIGSFSITLQPASYERTLASLELDTDSHVLEIGCGKGHALFYSALAYNVASITGIDFPDVTDFSRAVLSRYKAKYPDDRLDKISIKTLDFLSMTSLAGFTHVICIIQSAIVLQHLIKLLKENQINITVATIYSANLAKEFDELVKFKVNLESGSGSRTVCKFDSAKYCMDENAKSRKRSYVEIKNHINQCKQVDSTNVDNQEPPKKRLRL